MIDTDFTDFLPLPRSLDELYVDHQRRLDVQVATFQDLLKSVEQQIRLAATAKLILVLRYREAKLMGKHPAPESTCRSQESFCGDTGCEVHGLGPGPSSSPGAGSREPGAGDESARSSS